MSNDDTFHGRIAAKVEALEQSDIRQWETLDAVKDSLAKIAINTAGLPKIVEQCERHEKRISEIETSRATEAASAEGVTRGKRDTKTIVTAIIVGAIGGAPGLLALFAK